MKPFAAHILIVDDDDRLRQLLKRFLCDHGFAVNAASTTAEARQLMQWFVFDLMVLDVMIPGETGLEFARQLPAENKPAILMLSARADAGDRISGLETGVDDYLTKPFEPQELLLRLRAILKRTINDKQTLSLGILSVDLTTGACTIQGTPLQLTPAEMALMKALCSKAGKAFPRETLASIASLGNARSVDVQITRLRRKIDDAGGNSTYIRTLRGEGYGVFV